MSDEQNQTAHHVWISDEEKIISFHQEDGYREKVLNTQENFISFLLTLVVPDIDFNNLKASQKCGAF